MSKYKLTQKTDANGTTQDIQLDASCVDLSGYVPTSRTINSKALSSNITLAAADVKALPNFSLNISHQTSGNPRPVKFLTINYTSAATYFKMSATSCHDNGTSYQFLEDIIIGCTTGGSVVCNVYKYCQQEVTYDSATRNYGDVFYIIDTTNKIVDFYILCGQYASSQFTPATKIGNTTIAYITQYTGTASYYSSGTKVWANGNSTTYAKLSDISGKQDTLVSGTNIKTINGSSVLGSGDLTISASAPSNMATTDTAQTISGLKTMTNGLVVSGRSAGGGDDEGIVVGRAANNYAGLILGSPSGMRSVFYLTAANQPVWRWNNGSASYDIIHPAKAGTIALTSDIPTMPTYIGSVSSSTIYLDTLLSGKGVGVYMLVPSGSTLGLLQVYYNSGKYFYSSVPICFYYYGSSSSTTFYMPPTANQTGNNNSILFSSSAYTALQYCQVYKLS